MYIYHMYIYHMYIFHYTPDCSGTALPSYLYIFHLIVLRNFIIYIYIIIIIIIIIIMFVKGSALSLFLNPQSGVGPSVYSSVVQCSVFLPVCISVPVLAVYFCPSFVRVVATFYGIVLYPLLCSVLPFYSLYIDSLLYPILLSPVSISKIASVPLLNVVPLIYRGCQKMSTHFT